MSRKKERQEQLFAASVITAALLAIAIYLAIAISGYERAKGASAPEAQRVSVPQACEHLRREPDPLTWNEETDSYPPNHAWEECMGVGRK